MVDWTSRVRIPYWKAYWWGTAAAFLAALTSAIAAVLAERALVSGRGRDPTLGRDREIFVSLAKILSIKLDLVNLAIYLHLVYFSIIFDYI